MTIEQLRSLIDPGHQMITVSRQCQLVGLPKATYYYRPKGISDGDLKRMHLIDKIFTKWPFYGYRRLRTELAAAGLPTGKDRVRRLMRIMGIEAIYPKKRLSVRNGAEKAYPYLLRGLKIDHPDQVWCSDITYIPLRGGFAYLVAIMDWFSRYVISWELSMSLDGHFCQSALITALERSKPEIFNSDQGCQYTAQAFVDILLGAEIRISMDGKGRAFDNILAERLWRTVKYEEVYLKDYRNYFEASENLETFFDFYNTERRHSRLDDRTPAEVYATRTAAKIG